MPMPTRPEYEIEDGEDESAEPQPKKKWSTEIWEAIQDAILGPGKRFSVWGPIPKGERKQMPEVDSMMMPRENGNAKEALMAALRNYKPKQS